MWRFGIVAVCALVALPVAAQTVHQDLTEILTVKVTEIMAEEDRVVPGTDTAVSVQTVASDILSGDRAGEALVFENELTPLEVGDRAFITHTTTINGDEFYLFKDFVRAGPLWWLFVMFAVLLLFFARWQGARALLSLGLSVVAIFTLLIPALLAGYNPAWVSLGVAGIILALILFITHGFKPVTYVAFFGTFSAVLLTCVVAYVWVEALRFSGLADETAIYLNFSTNGSLDFAGLLLGSIIIGILGVLDDVSITQAAVVAELKAANQAMSRTELYKRAVRVGQSHVGSLVNTLAFAYVGVSLPLVLLFAHANADLFLSLNQEVIAAELTRILVGSIGLLLAVPLTTLVATWWFDRNPVAEVDVHHCGHHH